MMRGRSISPPSEDQAIQYTHWHNTAQPHVPIGIWPPGSPPRLETSSNHSEESMSHSTRAHTEARRVNNETHTTNDNTTRDVSETVAAATTTAVAEDTASDHTPRRPHAEAQTAGPARQRGFAIRTTPDGTPIFLVVNGQYVPNPALNRGSRAGTTQLLRRDPVARAPALRPVAAAATVAVTGGQEERGRKRKAEGEERGRRRMRAIDRGDGEGGVVVEKVEVEDGDERRPVASEDEGGGKGEEGAVV
ncbi:hypothetical protein CAC42_7710 [Sphaceloma murrayae]|uniref:Uncharacterized protein n=1 Tax=Sphaceloma murrayae TaxID=2082308 RepID=A0A2K1QXV2_9PEZI|nr:hypothetical protein CAC42_7710 [Sphaceloma murrayae]